MIFNTDLTTEKPRISDFLYHCEFCNNMLYILDCYRFKPKYKNKVIIELQKCNAYKERKPKDHLVKNRTYQLAFFELIKYFYDNYQILLKPNTVVSDFIDDHEKTTEPLTLKVQDIEVSMYYKNNTAYYTAHEVAFFLGLPLRVLTKYINLGYFDHITHLDHNNTRYISIESVMKFKALYRHDRNDETYPKLNKPAQELAEQDEQTEQEEKDELNNDE